MTSRMTPKLPSHSGMSPGGKEAPYLCPDQQVPDEAQGVPTPSREINLHKTNRGQPATVERLESFK